MIIARIKAALALPCLLLAAHKATAEAVPAFNLFMTNNSAVALVCRVRRDSGWSDTFVLKAGGSWEDRALGKGPIWVFCEAPAARTVYPILPGQRYSWLRDNPQSPVSLRRIVT